MTYVQFNFIDQYETIEVSFVGISSLLDSFGGYIAAIIAIITILAKICMKDKIIGVLRPIIEEQE